MRKIICHYHIYKNSGTSFDNLLTINYGDKHLLFDGPFPFFSIDQEQLLRIIDRKKDAIAFSSHQITLPVPTSLDVLILPVVFIRHPILRVQSIYNFKRKTYDGTVTSHNARDMRLEHWIDHCLNDKTEIVQISNAQTRMLGGTYRSKSLMRRKGSMMEYDLEQARRNIATVDLLARTEFFEHDVSRFTQILDRHGLKFSFEKIGARNSTRNDQHLTIEQRLENLRAKISSGLYRQLELANEQDIQLFSYASRKLDISST